MFPLTTPTLTLLLDVPAEHTMLQKLDKILDFLQGQTIGQESLVWTSSTMKLLRFERIQRSLGDYYRNPHPMFVSFLYPSIGEASCIKVRLTPEDVQAFLQHFHSMKLTIQTVVANISVSNKWTKEEDLPMTYFQ